MKAKGENCIDWIFDLLKEEIEMLAKIRKWRLAVCICWRGNMEKLHSKLRLNDVLYMLFLTTGPGKKFTWELDIKLYLYLYQQEYCGMCCLVLILVKSVTCRSILIFWLCNRLFCYYENSCSQKSIFLFIGCILAF